MSFKIISPINKAALADALELIHHKWITSNVELTVNVYGANNVTNGNQFFWYNMPGYSINHLKPHHLREVVALLKEVPVFANITSIRFSCGIFDVETNLCTFKVLSHGGEVPQELITILKTLQPQEIGITLKPQ